MSTQLKDIVTGARLNEFFQGLPPTQIDHFDKSMIFSTDEKMVGQWIDGKPLYQKTYDNLSVAVSTGETWTDLITHPTGLSKLVNAIIYGANNTIISPDQIATSASRGTIQVKGFRNALTVAGLIIQYTKTTDSPVTYIVDDEYEPRVEHCDTFDQNNPADVTVNFTLGSGSQLVDADELVLYQASSGNFVAVNTVKYNYTFTSIWLDPTAGFMNSTKLTETPMRIVFNKNGIAAKVIDFILPVILK